MDDPRPSSKATYSLTATDMVIRDADGLHIPADPRNCDRAAYEAWLDAGGVPSPAPGPSRAELDAAIGAACDAGIAKAFAAADGRSLRGSMNLWLGAVLARRIGGTAPSDDDETCLAMAPALDAWESAMFRERDRLLGAALTASDAKWPALPDGAAAFVASCDRG